MTTERRTLQFHSLDDIMPDVERLLRGHTTVGNWSLAQICNHLRIVMRRVVDLPASTPSDPSQWASDEQKRKVFESGRLPVNIAAPKEILPSDVLSDREEADKLRDAIAYYKASPGPVIPHRVFGPLTRDEWYRLQCIHCAHHLSFVIPHNNEPEVIAP